MADPTRELQALNLLARLRGAGNALLIAHVVVAITPLSAEDDALVKDLQPELRELLSEPGRQESLPPDDPEIRAWYDRQTPFRQECFQWYARREMREFGIDLRTAQMQIYPAFREVWPTGK